MKIVGSWLKAPRFDVWTLFEPKNSSRRSILWHLWKVKCRNEIQSSSTILVQQKVDEFGSSSEEHRWWQILKEKCSWTSDLYYFPYLDFFWFLFMDPGHSWVWVRFIFSNKWVIPKFEFKKCIGYKMWSRWYRDIDNMLNEKFNESSSLERYNSI